MEGVNQNGVNEKHDGAARDGWTAAEQAAHLEGEDLEIGSDGITRSKGAQGGPLNKWADEVGIVNNPTACSIGLDGAYFPPMRCWEGLTATMIVGAVVAVIANQISDFGLWEEDGGRGTPIRLLNIGGMLMAFCRFDSRYLFWTFLVGIVIFAHIGIILGFASAKGETANRTDITISGLTSMTVVWTMRSANLLYYQHLRHSREAGGAAQNRSTELHQALVSRGFQTGDVLLTGSAMDVVSFCSQYHTVSPWGHSAVVVRWGGEGATVEGEEDQVEAVRVRAAFALGYWLNRLRRRHRYWIMQATETSGMNELAFKVISSLSDDQLRVLDAESSGETGVTNGLELLRPFFTGTRQNGGSAANSPPAAVVAHQQKYPLHIPSSPTGTYVVEAVGSGSRMVTLQKFMQTWYTRRGECVAWRPLFSVVPDSRPKFTLELSRPYIGKPYPNWCGIGLSAFRRSRGENLKRLKHMRGSYFCSNFAAAVQQSLGILNAEVSPDSFLPDDFADESSHLSVNTYLLRSWVFGRIILIGCRADTDVLSRERRKSRSLTSTGLGADELSSLEDSQLARKHGIEWKS
jgi:hypothetical protein